jgi:hypothetical protein
VFPCLSRWVVVGGTARPSRLQHLHADLSVDRSGVI